MARDDDVSGGKSVTSPSPLFFSPLISPPPPPQMGASVSSVTRSKNPSAIRDSARVPHSPAMTSLRYRCDSSSSPESPHSMITVSSVSASAKSSVHPSRLGCRMPSMGSTMHAGIEVDRSAGGLGISTVVPACQHRHAAVRGSSGMLAKSRRCSLVAPAMRHIAKMRGSSLHLSIVALIRSAGIDRGSEVVSRSTPASAWMHSCRKVFGSGSSHWCIHGCTLLG